MRKQSNATSELASLRYRLREVRSIYLAWLPMQKAKTSYPISSRAIGMAKAAAAIPFSHGLWPPFVASARSIGTPFNEVRPLDALSSEALGLAWSDVHLDVRAVHVGQALQYRPGDGLHLVRPKTARSRRTVPLPDQVVEALKSQKSTAEPGPRGGGRVVGGLGSCLYHGGRHSGITSERLPGVQEDHRACRAAPSPSP